LRISGNGTFANAATNAATNSDAILIDAEPSPAGRFSRHPPDAQACRRVVEDHDWIEGGAWQGNSQAIGV
jgi:hypothetical protein